jgi:hypothetical protein
VLHRHRIVARMRPADLILMCTPILVTLHSFQKEFVQIAVQGKPFVFCTCLKHYKLTVSNNGHYSLAANLERR